MEDKKVLSFLEKRRLMVYELKHRYNVTSPEILSVLLQIPREQFVPSQYREIAYADQPIPIGFGQTMSQPYTVAFMTELLDLVGNEKVLEIGTGSGYQAAVLSYMVKELFSVEIVRQLGEKAQKTLKQLQIKNVHIKVGDGEEGRKEFAPFDAIIITAGVEGNVPQELFNQLKVDGILVAPVGNSGRQIMSRFTKLKDGTVEKKEFGEFAFVPFVKKE